jgi:hypothetical protein
MGTARLGYRNDSDSAATITLGGELEPGILNALDACVRAAVGEGKRQFVVDVTGVVAAEQSVVTALSRLRPFLESTQATLVAVATAGSNLAAKLQEAGLGPQGALAETRYGATPPA